MAEIVPTRQSFEAVSGFGAGTIRPLSRADDEVKAKILADTTFFQKVWHQAMNAKDPNFDKWKGIEGYEEYADELVTADSQGEQDGLKAIIDRRKFERTTADNGELGFLGDVIAGVASPMNFIPIPAVRGMGFVKGLVVGAGINAAQTSIGEVARQWSDPTATAEESYGNIAFGALIGGVLGGPSGAWGAHVRARAQRQFDMGLGEHDGPSLAVTGIDEFGDVIYERPHVRQDGTVPKIDTTSERTGYEMKVHDGVNYVSPDGLNWVRFDEQNHPNPTPIDPATLAILDVPEPVIRDITRIDDGRFNRDYNNGQWQAEIESYRPPGDVTPVDQIIRNRKDYVNFRVREHFWERREPIGPTESVADYRQRIGKRALEEFNGSKVSGRYAGNAFVSWGMEKLNFSPVAKAIKTSNGDNVVADMVFRIAGDYGWAIKANEFNYSAPPSILLKGLRHTARWQQFRKEFDAEWVKFVSGNQQSSGRQFQNANVTAQLYAMKRGGRRLVGQNVLDYYTFSEMVGKAVFDQTAFSHRGFPVNDNIRNAAKAYTRMMQEYDALQREAGVFKDQRKLTGDIRRWNRQAIDHQHRVNQWLWGQAGMPAQFLDSIKVTTQNGVEIFSGDSHEEAIANMLDTLGDQGILFADSLTRADYGYLPRANPDPANWTDMNTMTQQRVASLSTAQRAIYDQKRSSLDMIEANIATAELELSTLSASPHQFLDAAGNPEPYFNRYWNKSQIAANQEQITWLIEQWFIRDNPHGARGRAEDTVMHMLEESGTTPRTGSVSHLSARALNIPNSFTASHPQFGDIAVADFINLNVLSTSEHYIHSAGMTIETARMFGDAEMKAAKADLHQHLMDKYWDPQTTDEGRLAAIAQITEIEAHVRNSAEMVLGQFKHRDPWALDNRIARTWMDLATLSMLGKAAITSMVDVMRGPMTQGFSVFFSHAFRRMFDDIAAHGPDMAMGGLTNEVFDMAGTQHNMRVSMMEHGQPDVGGTWLENAIHDRLPGFFKINGLSSLTVFLKTLVMDCAQHSVMSDAIRIADIVRAGGQLTPEDTLRLNALGIKPRDAVLLAQMPYETWKNGKLILPATHKWQGNDGKHAKQILLNAIHAEARRAIVTPSIGDRSTIFNGVFTIRGEKVKETDLMKIPMQFLSYGVAAHNKVLASALQGRDRDRLMGMFSMVAMAYFANYFKTESNTWKSKNYDDLIFEAVEKSGITGMWFGDLNGMLERVSNERIGIRPSLIRPLTGTESKSKKSDLDAALSVLGPAPSKTWELGKAFVDPKSTASDYASAVRKAVPYNNVLWWERLFRDMTGEVASSFEGDRR